MGRKPWKVEILGISNLVTYREEPRVLSADSVCRKRSKIASGKNNALLRALLLLCGTVEGSCMADNTYGISQADWDKVTGCAEAIRRLGVQVINGDLNKSEWTFERSVAAERARSLLAELMDKYGRIPPLLSLLASYAKDEAEREQVLRERWELASHNADRAEMLRSAMELATHFALGGDLFQARRWIGDLKKLSADAAELRWIEELVWQQIKG